MKTTIDMAREAGLFTHKEVQAELKAFEALVRADERKIIENRVNTLDEPMTVRLNVINKAIRNRGNT